MRVLPLLALVFTLGGCAATSDVMRLDESTRIPSEPSKVTVLLDEPARAYTVIAMIEVYDQGWGLSLDELKQSMVDEVAALGGDAVIVGTTTSQSDTVLMPVGNMYYGVNSTEKKLIGKVVVFADK